MNVTYKLIKNKSGHTVVASELAKGHKKNSQIAASALLLASLASIGSAGVIDLTGYEYTSGTLEKNGTTFTIKDSDNGTLDGNGYDGRKTKIINNGATDSIKFGNATVEKVDTGGFIQTLNFASMWEDGYVKLYKKDGTNLIPITELPTWPTLNFQKTENFTWVSNNGELRTIRIYSLDNEDMTIGSPGQFEEIILVKQPPVPYYKFNVATVLDGTMNLDDTQDKLDWFFGQIKQSNIFSAISNTAAEAKIIVGTNDPNESVSMTMTFFPGYMTTDSGTVVSSKQEFGPTKAYVGTFKNSVLATALGLTSDDFTVTNIAELRIYQAQITEAISKNLILEGTFDHHFNMATVSKYSDEYLAEVEYDAKVDRDDLYLVDVFGKAADRNSILKADGSKATIEIKENAQLKAYYGQIAHGMNNAVITNYATIALGDETTYGNTMSNLYLISNAEYTNKGTLIYGYQPKDATSGGVWDGQKNYFAFVDIVQNAKFINENDMFVGGYHSQKFNKDNKIPLAFNGLGEKSIRSAVNISGKNALFHNKSTGTMYVGSMDIVNSLSSSSESSVFSNGVSVNNGANWINDGKIYVGKKVNANGDVVNSNITYHLYDVLLENDYLLNQTNNAVFANISSATEELSIVNNGEITIGSAMKDLSSDYIQNGAAINIEYQNDNPAQVDKINVVNKGTINVGGYHSVGMRFFGQVGSDQGPQFLGNDVDGVINITGSNNVGIMAANGAIAYNKGIINVGDPNAKGGAVSDLFNLRAYGIRAEDGTIYIDGANSQINLVGDHSVGVHARVGGKVELTGNITMNSTNDAKNNLVYYWISGRKALGNGQFESSEIKFAPGNVILAINDNNSTLFRVDQQATFDSSSAQGNYEFTVSGEKSRGLYVANQGTTVKADGKDANSKVVFKVEGKGSTGIYVTSSAGKNGTTTGGQVLLGENTTIYVAGENASAAVVDGTVFSVNGVALRKDTAILTSKATLTDSTVTFDKGVSGYRLINNGELQHTGKIDFTGAKAVQSGNAVGVYINGGHLNNMNGGEIVVNGIGVDIYGKDSIVSNLGSVKAVNGIAAVRLNKDASLTVKGSNPLDVIKGEKDADALLVHAGATLATSNAQIAVDGKGAGIHFLNMDQDGSGQFKLSGSGTITVKGNDATGILVEGEDANKQPTMGTSDFISDNSSGLIINVEDVGGNGITVNTSGKVHSGASVNIQSTQGQSALVLKGDTTQIIQSGNLSSNSETSAVVELKDLTSTQDINFTNLGSIKVNANSAVPNLVAINANIGKNINLTNGESGTSKGEITGVVALGNQKNQVTLFGGSKADVIAATAGETSIMLKDVQRNQSDQLFNKLSAGNGANDSIELSATSGKSSHYALTQAKANEITGFEQLKIHANSIFELDNSDITLNESAPNGGIHLDDATGILFVNQSQATGKHTFNHNLYGNGVVKTDINGKDFAFDATKANLIGDKFTGKLQLENAVFNLKNENTKALTNATLSIGQKSQTIVEDGIGKQNIGGLSFDHGRLTFNDLIPNMETIGQVADGSIHAKNLDFTNAKGTVDIHVDSIKNDVKFVTDKPILEQDTGESIIQLVSSDQVTGVSTGGLKLEIYDSKGQLVQQSDKEIILDITQSNKPVAKGTYGYGLQSFKDANSATADGLYVSYKLLEIELLTKGDEATILHAAAGKTGNGADLAAKVTGAGDLIIATDSDYLSLSNGTNNYTGVTDVRKGGLVLENNDVLGQTSLLKLGEQTYVSIFGKEANKDGVTQAVGAVTSAQNSLIHLGNKGELTVKGDVDSTIDGNIVGGSAAKLIFDKANNIISSQNSGLASRVEINNDATLQTYHSTSIGNAGDVVIADDAKLLLGNYDAGNTGFSKALNGKGEVIITESLLNGQKTGSDIAFKADNSNFKGDIAIGQTTDTLATRLTVTDSLTLGSGDNVTINGQGTLNLNFNGVSDWKLDKNVMGTGNLEKDGAGTVELTAKAAQYTGTTTVKNGLLVAGTINDPVTLNSQLLNIEAHGAFLGSGEIKGSVNNSGSFSIGRLDKVETDAAMKYTVNGDFTNQGVINLNVKYPDEDYTSKTNTNAVKHGNIGNELIITGNYIANGGSIYLNTVLNKGKSETSTDFITVGGNVIKQGGATQLFIQNYGGLGAATLPDAIKVVDVAGTSDNGSFILGKPATIGIYEYTLQKGKNDNSWYLSSNPDDPVIDPEKKINPRVGAYLANMAMAFEMFNVTLHDRLGNPDYGQGFLTGDEDGISAWGRIVTVHKDYTAVNKRLNISGDYYVAQVGADLIKVAAENDAQYRFGVMAGYGNSDFTSTSRHTSSKADAKIDQAMSFGIYGTWYQPESWFVDTWIQYSHFKNEISMKNSTTSKYNSDLISASIELGYNHRTDDLSNGDHLILQPNAQVIYGHLSTKEYEDMDSGLRVASNKKNNVQTRLGMKVFYIAKDSNFRPYVEGNWIYNSSNMGVNFNDKFTFSSNAPKSRYEVKLGVEGELSKEWSLWGNVSYQFGKDNYKGYKAMLGAKYTW